MSTTVAEHGHPPDKEPATVVLHVGGMLRATETAVVETVLRRRPGVLAVEANPVSQTANVTFDPSLTSVAELRRWVEDCGFHCAGQSVPEHICDPLMEPDPPHAMMHAGHATVAEPPAAPTGDPGHAGHEVASVAPAPEHAGHEMGATEMSSPHDMMGHG